MLIGTDTFQRTVRPKDLIAAAIKENIHYEYASIGSDFGEDSTVFRAVQKAGQSRIRVIILGVYEGLSREFICEAVSQGLSQRIYFSHGYYGLHWWRGAANPLCKGRDAELDAQVADHVLVGATYLAQPQYWSKPLTCTPDLTVNDLLERYPWARPGVPGDPGGGALAPLLDAVCLWALVLHRELCGTEIGVCPGGANKSREVDALHGMTHESYARLIGQFANLSFKGFSSHYLSLKAGQQEPTNGTLQVFQVNATAASLRERPSKGLFCAAALDMEKYNDEIHAIVQELSWGIDGLAGQSLVTDSDSNESSQSTMRVAGIVAIGFIVAVSVFVVDYIIVRVLVSKRWEMQQGLAERFITNVQLRQSLVVDPSTHGVWRFALSDRYGADELVEVNSPCPAHFAKVFVCIDGGMAWQDAARAAGTALEILCAKQALSPASVRCCVVRQEDFFSGFDYHLDGARTKSFVEGSSRGRGSASARRSRSPPEYLTNAGQIASRPGDYSFMVPVIFDMATYCIIVDSASSLIRSCSHYSASERSSDSRLQRSSSLCKFVNLISRCLGDTGKCYRYSPLKSKNQFSTVGEFNAEDANRLIALGKEEPRLCRAFLTLWALALSHGEYRFVREIARRSDDFIAVSGVRTGAMLRFVGFPAFAEVILHTFCSALQPAKLTDNRVIMPVTPVLPLSESVLVAWGASEEFVVTNQRRRAWWCPSFSSTSHFWSLPSGSANYSTVEDGLAFRRIIRQIHRAIQFRVLDIALVSPRREKIRAHFVLKPTEVGQEAGKTSVAWDFDDEFDLAVKASVALAVGNDFSSSHIDIVSKSFESGEVVLEILRPMSQDLWLFRESISKTCNNLRICDSSCSQNLNVERIGDLVTFSEPLAHEGQFRLPDEHPQSQELKTAIEYVDALLRLVLGSEHDIDASTYNGAEYWTEAKTLDSSDLEKSGEDHKEESVKHVASDIIGCCYSNKMRDWLTVENSDHRNQALRDVLDVLLENQQALFMSYLRKMQENTYDAELVRKVASNSYTTCKEARRGICSALHRYFRSESNHNIKPYFKQAMQQVKRYDHYIGSDAESYQFASPSSLNSLTALASPTSSAEEKQLREKVLDKVFAAGRFGRRSLLDFAQSLFRSYNVDVRQMSSWEALEVEILGCQQRRHHEIFVKCTGFHEHVKLLRALRQTDYPITFESVVNLWDTEVPVGYADIRMNVVHRDFEACIVIAHEKMYDVIENDSFVPEFPFRLYSIFRCLELGDPYSDPAAWCLSFAQLEAFTDEVRQSLGPDFYTVSMHDVVKRFVKPQTKEARRSYACMLNRSQLKPVQIFVSHCWRERYCIFWESILDSVKSYAEMSNISLWICPFALFQSDDKFELKQTIGNSIYDAPFEKALAKASEFLVVRNDTVDIYTRAWCVYEIFRAKQLGLPITVAGPSQLCAGDVDILNCEASDPEDLQMIIDAIQSADQVDEVNRLVMEVRSKAT
eukprot:TRINITY_DN5247_c0_g1_i2.p1 TRINITY_DN5247_c0_g1~~TRINITY_DN5247_c0_g1_i2.p1  ORF type:complete len:1474 (+),score=178.95 TRINITY_DN5247_c0_g1_i2:527-4948(+)